MRKGASKLGKIVMYKFTPFIPLGILYVTYVIYVFITWIFYINFNGFMSGFNIVNFPCFRNEIVNSTIESEINSAFTRVVTVW